MPVLQIVIASTRPGRVGAPVAAWFTAVARRHGAFEVEVTDLADLGLPLLDEPNHPRLGRYEHDHTKAWSATIAGSDAVAFVMPEYNHSFNAALKNALDYLYREWNHKAAGFVSYGGVSGGTRSVQSLKPVLGALQMYPVVQAVNIPHVAQYVDEGDFQPPDELAGAAEAMLDELARVTEALIPLRADLS